MRELLDGFKAAMNFDLKTWHNLRALSKPLYRYGKSDSEVVDGGVFAFVLTTDPEVYLLLEARTGKNGLEWQYAFAPEASSPIRCTWKGKEVWNFEFTGADNHSGALFRLGLLSRTLKVSRLLEAICIAATAPAALFVRRS